MHLSLNRALRRLALGLMAASACALATSPTLAAGKKMRPPVIEDVPPEPMGQIEAPLPMGYDWSGYYAGGEVGFAHGMWTEDFYRNNNHGHSDLGMDGTAWGIFAGYNTYISPKTLIGAEVDLGSTGATQMNNIYDNDTSYSAISTNGSLRGRMGYALDRVMLYGTAGLAFANITNDIQKGRNAGEQIVWDNQTRYGYAAGAGAEYAMTNHWLARAEYLYENFGQVTLFNADNEKSVSTNSLHQLRVGLSYKF